MPRHHRKARTAGLPRWWREVLAALICLGMGLWSVTTPSLWRDESVTAYFARMPLGEAFDQWREWDAVHALNYLAVRCLYWLEPVELAVRMPSVIAMACAAAMIVRLGTRLATPAAGLIAGVVFALMPVTSYYAQEGRSYAMATALVVASMLATLRLRERPSVGSAALYAFTLALVGYAHAYAMLIVLVQFVWIVAVPDARARMRGVRAMLVAWVGAGALLLPLIIVASGQRDVQLFWLTRPDVGALIETADVFASTIAIGATLALLAVVGAIMAPNGRLVLAWAVIPVAVNWLISQSYPMYQPRYVLFVVPAVVLCAAIGTASLADVVPRFRNAAQAVLGVLLVGTIVVCGRGEHLANRQPDSKPDNIRALTAYIEERAQPGDGIVPITGRIIAFVSAYGGPFERLPIMADDQVDPDVKRVWVTTSGRVDPQDPKFDRLETSFEYVSGWKFGYSSLSLWTRR